MNDLMQTTLDFASVPGARLTPVGLEQYRFNSLIDFARNNSGHVFYVIHNSYGPDNVYNTHNCIDDWLIASIGRLQRLPSDYLAWVKFAAESLKGEKQWHF